ncbi:glycosyltransferase family 4 protein [Arenimonas fontis]|uniref:Glycosyltransferase family 1 protein n=1 Tax=Arenimonas fontis TaxID=2608255 RepID=A0A5B2ZF79_9GAMM|nr:glycosyltransferase family 1 protein [Arenimonas fontis]KAA2285854.1 glycosyltransferase family 1 protein [Arenimonas fontis]
MHIELVTETWPPEVNGVALTVQSMAEGLRQLGHQVGVVRPERPEESPRPDPMLMLVEGAPMPRYPGLRFGLPAGRRLTARWSAARPDAVYIATEGPLGWSALRTCRRLGIPVATGFHTRFDDYVGRYGAGFLGPWVLAWLRRFHNRADATLVPTEELRESLLRNGFRHPVRLARAVDTRTFHPGWRDSALRADWQAGPDTPVVMHVGRIAPEKNLELAVRAFRALQAERPDARFVWVGDGPARERLQSANPDFLFAGIRRGDDLARHFASADLFCFPSLSETFGNVTLEAMASGVATVAFDYGAAREHLRDGEHGAAVPFGHEDGFVQAFVRTALHPRRAAMGAAARKAVEHLHPLAVAGDLASLLAALGPRRERAA